MRRIEAPEPYTAEPGDGPSVFLAGGITACPDWQRAACDRLGGVDVVLFDPRRAAFDTALGDTAEQQIAWEYRHLRTADVTLFWFPACDPRVTVQPIALFELGAAIAQAQLGRRRFVVGADPDYPRRLDVVLPTAQRAAGRGGARRPGRDRRCGDVPGRPGRAVPLTCRRARRHRHRSRRECRRAAHAVQDDGLASAGAGRRAVRRHPLSRRGAAARPHLGGL